MSITSENRRQEALNQTKQELSKLDSLRARNEIRATADLAKISKKSVELEEGLRNEQSRILQEQVGDLDELQRMKLDYDFKKMADFLGIEGKDFDDSKNALKFLMEWGMSKSRTKDILGVLSLLKGIKNQMGFKEIGMTGIKKLYQYARLDMDEQRIQREKKLLKEK